MKLAFIFCIAIGGLLFGFGIRLYDAIDERIRNIGLTLLFSGILIIVLTLFSAMTHTTASAAGRTASAGITQITSNYTADALLTEEEFQQVSPADIELLARLMTAEQGYNAPEEEYYLTGSVVLNRMNMERYPNTLQGVIYDDGQYQCVADGHINRPYDEVAWQVAEELLLYGTTIPEDVIYQAEFLQGSREYTQKGITHYCYR